MEGKVGGEKVKTGKMRKKEIVDAQRELQGELRYQTKEVIKDGERK